jgi:hypothetical protein
MFKKGDKVKCISSVVFSRPREGLIIKGKTYIIESVVKHVNSKLLTCKLQDIEYTWSIDRFKLVTHRKHRINLP